ncbi:MAG: MFS transporter [Gammaproteobacteria bacterium]|nr:MFS transporter [Gammaproteobacteria bacterium]
MSDTKPPPFTSVSQILLLFMVFGASYFISNVLRAIMASLSPIFIEDLNLEPRHLGLLASAYFVGFSLPQLHIGKWLDKYGPKRILLSFLAIAIFGCILFSIAQNFVLLWFARLVLGLGVSACLMAPLAGYRKWVDTRYLVRLNSWMLMVGSFGIVASTVPVHWLLNEWNFSWRQIFLLIVLWIVLICILIYIFVPSWQPSPVHSNHKQENIWQSYRPIFQSRYFRAMLGIGAINYGGLVAIQTLWLAPWLKTVYHLPADEATDGLFFMNLLLMAVYALIGIISTRLNSRGWSNNKIIKITIPCALLSLFLLIYLGEAGNLWIWGLFLFFSAFCSLTQPTVALRFPIDLGGRVLSGYNLAIFSGAFFVQAGLGVLVDLFRLKDWSNIAAYQGAFSVFLVLACITYAIGYTHLKDESS